MTNHRFNQLYDAARSARSSGSTRQYRQALDLIYLEAGEHQLEILRRAHEVGYPPLWRLL